MTESRKKIVREKPPETLLWELRVDLDTELSLEKCIHRLESANKTSPFASALWNINIIAADAIYLEFSMRYGNEFIKAWMLGHAVFQGTVGIDPSILLLFGILLLIPVGVLISTGAFGGLLLGGIITAIAIAFLYHSARDMRYKVVDQLETLLLD